MCRVSRWRSIVLTGASGGIGQALAVELAAPGVRLFLSGRDRPRLEAVAAAVRNRGAISTLAVFDVTEGEALAKALERFDAERPVDLVIANAGISSGLGPARSLEPPDRARRVLRVNVDGMLNTVEPLIPAMLARGSGHIALMSSLAALRPLPDMPAYSASKAAVRAYGTSLRGWLEPRGLTVTVISPGFVTSAMSKRHRGRKPFELSAERAARRIHQGLARRRAHVTFPWPLALLTWLDAHLPARVSDWFAKGFAAEILPDERH